MTNKRGNQTMQAVCWANGRLTFRDDYPPPTSQPDEALVRVTLAGICATDLEMVKGYVPEFTGVLGHEFVGIVEAAQDESWVGRRVVSSINIGCQTCQACLENGPEHCPNRQVLGIHQRDGVFAEYVSLPLRNLHRVLGNITDEQAVFTEPLAAALRIREQITVRPSAKVAVLGPGKLGLLVAQVLSLAGGDVTVIGRRAASLALPASLALQTGLSAHFKIAHFDLVVEVTGSSNGFQEALRLVRPLGTIILKSTIAGDNQINLTKIAVDEITVLGSRCGPFTPALRLLAQGDIQTQSLINAEFPLNEATAAFEKAAQPGVLKVLLRP